MYWQDSTSVVEALISSQHFNIPLYSVWFTPLALTMTKYVRDDLSLPVLAYKVRPWIIWKRWNEASFISVFTVMNNPAISEGLSCDELNNLQFEPINLFMD